jgi:RNA polymerase sigma factor (sigma-70 family)
MALTSDARLVARVRRGDDKAFERIYARHQPAILSFCRHLTGSREDAEDAVQHTFLAAYRRIFESEGELDLRPWLFTVARNRCLSLLRARRADGSVDPEGVEAVTDGLAAEVERRQELRDLVVDLGRLPDEQRAALVLSQLEALSHREVGVVLGVAPAKVKALVFQARSTLVSTRAARAAPCTDVREELATARGSARRRRTLRSHVQECEGCRTFEADVLRQRHNLELLLPVAPTAGLAQAILGREGAVAGGGGAAAATAASGGAGGGLAGSLGAVGLPGVVKLAVVAVVAVGGTTGAVAAELPERIREGVSGETVADRVPFEPRARDVGTGSGEVPAPGLDGAAGNDGRGAEREAGEGAKRPATDDQGATAAGPGGGSGAGESTAAPSDGNGGEGGGQSNLPPGLAKKDELPPGLAKKDKLPPGLAKQGDAPPGKAKTPKEQAPGNGGGQGNGNGQAGGQGNGNGQGNGGGQGNGQGNGSGNPSGGENGQGNGSGGGNGGSGGNGGNGPH